ncbi:MAG: PhnD/SsuA/transferrin family substrate-binding protein, partial [Deltaproteobacteria bacterium]|nr:PhnD/SsuA/transferrin family substrate-binding protein [Deltaproteobacteria bacterium]
MTGGEDNPEGPGLEPTLVVPPAKTLGGKYQLGRMLGEGGMGSVYEAEHVGLAKRVAIKLLSENYAEDEIFVKRFRREARAMAAVTHDNVVQVMDTGEDEDGIPFIVMELLEGEPLASVIRRERVLTPSAATDIAAQVLAGLAAAHKKGIIHRDLKPANVFLTQTEDGHQRTKVLDFGISKFSSDLTNVNMTAEGAVIGTPAYMSPEQVKGRSDVDQRADLYAVGVMLYRMLTGRLPFAAKKPRQIYDKILKGDPKPIQTLQPTVPDALVAVVMKAMSLRRSERYATAEEFFEDLRGAMPDMEATGPLPVITRSSAGGSLFPPTGTESGPTRDARGSGAPSFQATTGRVRESQEGGGQGPGPKPNALLLGLLAAVLLAGGVALIYNARSNGAANTTADAGPETEGPDAQAGAAALTGTPIVYGVSRYTELGSIHRTHDPLVAFLEGHLRRPVELRVVEDSQLDDALGNGELTFAALSAQRYVEQRGAHPSMRLVATGVNPGGASYVGVVLVQPDSGIESLDGLVGKVMCFPGRDSTSGYLYPAALFRGAGINPVSDFRSVNFHQGDHSATLRALAAGDCDGAAVYAAAIAEAGYRVQSFHQIASTQRIPNDAYVIAPGVSAEDS